MNRFVIVDDLPYLFANGKTYAVRWDDKGFTVGTEVKLTSVPNSTLSELSVKAKCAGNLDSIGRTEEKNEFDKMTVAELKAYAEAASIDLSGAKNKAEIIEAIREGEAK